MYTKVFHMFVLISALMISGCATTTDKGTTERAGMIIGGILGGVLGSKIGDGDDRNVAIIIGSIAGAAIGGYIGRTMDEDDRLKTAQALENVRTGVPSSWQNPDTGNQYTVVPTKTYETESGLCREYTIDAYVEGKEEKIYGTACRQQDGSWEVQN